MGGTTMCSETRLTIFSPFIFNCLYCSPPPNMPSPVTAAKRISVINLPFGRKFMFSPPQSSEKESSTAYPPPENDNTSPEAPSSISGVRLPRFSFTLKLP